MRFRGIAVVHGHARPLLLDQDAGRQGADAADGLHELRRVTGGASISIAPPRSLRSSVPCTPAAISFSGANSRSASAMRRPVSSATAPPRPCTTRSSTSTSCGRHVHRIGRGRDAEQRAVDIEEQRPCGRRPLQDPRHALCSCLYAASRLSNMPLERGNPATASSSATKCAPSAMRRSRPGAGRSPARDSRPVCVSTWPTTEAALTAAARSASCGGLPSPMQAVNVALKASPAPAVPATLVSSTGQNSDGLLRAEERAVAAVGHDHVARPQLAQRGEEGGQAHLVAAAGKAARGKPWRRLARLERQRAAALAEAGHQPRHQHVGLRAIDGQDVDLRAAPPGRRRRARTAGARADWWRPARPAPWRGRRWPGKASADSLLSEET